VLQELLKEPEDLFLLQEAALADEGPGEAQAGVPEAEVQAGVPGTEGQGDVEVRSRLR